MTSIQQHVGTRLPTPREAPAEPRTVAPTPDPEELLRRPRPRPRGEYWDVGTASWRRYAPEG